MDTKKSKGKSTNKNFPVISNKILNNFSNDNYNNTNSNTNNCYKIYSHSKTTCFENIKNNGGSILEYLEKSNSLRKKTEEIEFDN